MDPTTVSASIFAASPAQPNQQQYPFDPNLIVFKEFASRADFVAQTGLQPPAGDASKGRKNWLDPSQFGKTGNVSYNTWNPATGSYDPLVIDCADAASVNLEGAPTYPAYVPPPATTQVIAQLGPTLRPLDASVLCTPANAALIASEIGGTVVPYPLQDGQTVTDPTNYLGISMPVAAGLTPVTLNAGRLATIRFQAGVGAPGTWGPGGSSWTPTTTEGANVFTLPAVPTPMRQALANEAPVQQSGAGISTWAMGRTDLAAAATSAVQSAEQISQILVTLKQLQATLQGVITLLDSK